MLDNDIEDLAALKEIRKLAGTINHHYAMARTNTPRYKWHLAEKNKFKYYPSDMAELFFYNKIYRNVLPS